MSANVSIATYLADICVLNYMYGREGVSAARLGVQWDHACGMRQSLPLQPRIIKSTVPKPGVSVICRSSDWTTPRIT